MAPDSKTRVWGSVLTSSSAGIFEFGLIETKPLPNCSPSLILMSQASYSAPPCPKAKSSSSITVTFTPFGVPNEYNCKGCFPIGSSFSSWAPAVGRFIFSNLPPLCASHFQTFGGTNPVIAVFLFVSFNRFSF